jgi:ribonucleoside-triphosphate reductase
MSTMDLYQQYIHISRYSRFNYELGRRETWKETVQRYVDYFDARTGHQFTQLLQGKVKDYILTLKTMPSMRALMTAGEALDRENLAGFNCFAGDVRFMTRDGNKTFRETVGTTQDVLAGDGVWRKAEVRSFGEQKVQTVVLRPGSRSRTQLRLEIKVTPDHRWITQRGEVTDLRVGDTVPFNGPVAPEFSAEDFIRGLGFGDGTLDARGHARIRLGLRDDIEFRVMSIEDAGIEEVFCVTEPVTGQFTLAGGVLTGNCSYLAVNSKRSFSEALYILMCGTGVGFSCEKSEVARLPVIPDELISSEDKIVVADSKEGWAKAYHRLLGHLWDGDIPKLDYSKVRKAGERLKVFGGRASGPEPLKKLFEFTINMFQRAKGRRLTSMEVHDIMCMIGEIVVVGGVRRSAMISLSNINDKMLATAKSNFNVDQYSLINETDTEWVYTVTMKKNQPVHPTYKVVLRKKDQDWVRSMLEVDKKLPWFILEPQRGLANNSVAYESRPEAGVFLEEWTALVKSMSGERGIFNREAARKQASKWGRRSATADYGTNPCSEIVLRDKQLCNLSEVIIREDDTLETLKDKVEVATILGTLQATLTDFGFVSEAWVKNTADEALLGVSLTGIYDNPLTAGARGFDVLAETLNTLRDHTRAVNEKWAAMLGIKPAAAITCVKPSGTVSQLCNTASGIHPRHNRNYIRTVRIDKKDPLYQFMVDAGFVIEDDKQRPQSTAVVSFPMSAPANAVTRDQVSALEALDLWLLYQREWCEHKPSVTISVRDSEWMAVGAWVYEHFDEVSGVSFLPLSEHTYEQAPYQDMTEQQFAEWNAAHPTPDIKWEDLSKYEQDDNTVAMQSLACVAGVCELPGT